jgi:hypothetical protein
MRQGDEETEEVIKHAPEKLHMPSRRMRGDLPSDLPCKWENGSSRHRYESKGNL